MKRLLPLLLLLACTPAFAQKISALPSASALTGTELVPVVQAGATVSTTTSAFGTYLTGVFGLAGWPSAAGIPCYSGTLSWCSSYSAANPIPASLGGTGLTSITANDCLAGNSGGTAFTFVVCGGAPGGGNTQIQFNGSGVFSGSANLTWNGTALGIGVSGTAGTIVLGNATSGTVTLGTVTGALGAVTASLPANTGTVAETNFAQSFSALQTFPANDISIAGTTISALSGSGGVLAETTSPVFTTPNLGTPSALNLTNALALPCAATPALTGDVTTTAGSCATTVSKVNGASVPASAAFLYTNPSSQPLAGSLAGCLSVTGGVLSCPALFNPQSGTTYTVQTSDNGKIVPLTNAAAKTLTVPIASTLGNGFSVVAVNEGAGTATASIASGSFAGGLASFSMAQNTSCEFDSDGTSVHLSACTALSTGGGSGTPEDVQVFTSSGTWTKPSGSPKQTDVMCIGGGGGGGSGAVVASGTAASGGGGGGGGSLVEMLFPTSALTSTVTVTIATAANGGAAVTATGAGHAGTNGSNSTFGSYLTAYGGGNGGAGSSGASSQGGSGAGLLSAASGITKGSVCAGQQTTGASGGDTACATGGSAGAGTASAAAGNSGGNSLTGGSGGGSGGGVTTTPTAQSGGTSGAVGNAAAVNGGGAGTAGTAGSIGVGAYAAGTGGGGGGSSITANAGAGGNAAIGGGGGGGGVALNGIGNSGAGGTGGAGECVVTTTY